MPTFAYAGRTRAGQDVSADLGALLQHDDGEFRALFGGKLLQPECRGEPSRSGADNDDVELHGLALDRLRIDRFWLRRFVQGFAPNRQLPKSGSHSRMRGNPVSINMV